jgi:hypothetical protein
MEIGKLGVFSSMDSMPAPASISFCRRIERMGYRSGLDDGRDGTRTLRSGRYLLANTTSLIYATGIANVWARDPMTMAVAAKTLAEQKGGNPFLHISGSN